VTSTVPREAVATASLTGLLERRGYPNQVLRGVRALGGRRQFAAPAYTARLLPSRPGLAPEIGAVSLRALLADVPPGHVLVVDGLGRVEGALIGDLMATWLVNRGVVGVVTDGGVRDADVLAGLDLVVVAGGVTPSLRSTRFEIADRQRPIACGGVTVLPGDVLVGDGDGVLVLPQGEADELLSTAAEQEDFEQYVALRLRAGAEPDGLFPPDAAHRAEYETWRAERAARNEMETR
jgi:regulator of RNase E activity RraA